MACLVHLGNRTVGHIGGPEETVDIMVPAPLLLIILQVRQKHL